jgi:hypothetical protein
MTKLFRFKKYIFLKQLLPVLKADKFAAIREPIV